MDNRIDARIAALEIEIGRLKAALGDKVDGASTSDRRGMLKLIATTAVGAVTGGAILNAQPAAAADGDAVYLGQPNESVAAATQMHCADNSALVVTSDAHYGIEAAGGLGNALFNPGGVSPEQSAGQAGALLIDVNGDWWAATATDPNDAHWRKIAGPSTAGQLHLLPAPVRVYDSRAGQAPADVDPKAPTTPNEPRGVDTTLNDSGVPTTANGVLINLTITGPKGNGFATAWPTGAWPGTSNVNFAAGQDVAATAVVGCGPDATIQVLASVVTDFIVDVSGYYL
ncbi:MAG TPA: hypothetical protein VGC84_15015 [Ilumatobacteraceae bacterium]|jgi:hypothetical protein